MENLKYSLFDFFAYLLPGIVLASFIIFVFGGLNLCSDLKSVLLFVSTNVNLYSAVLFLFFSYIVGFISSIFAKYFVDFKEYWLPPTKGRNINMGHSEKYIIARDMSKDNFLYIERWNVLRNMTANLAFNIFVIAICAPFFFKCISYKFSVLGIIVSAALIFQSSKYQTWVNIDLDNLVHYLQGSKNVKKTISDTKK